MKQRLIVVGGDAAGMTAASQARRIKGPDELEIVAFERGRFTSYSACGIPYLIGGIVEDFSDLIVRTPERFREKHEIEAHVRHEVTAIDPSARRVEVRDLDTGNVRKESYDHLVVATGAVPIRPLLEGADADGILGIQTLDDGIAALEKLEEVRPSKAVIVGGGYIGLEMAEALLSRDIDTTLVEAAPQPMTTLDPDMGALVADALAEQGAEVLVEEPATAFSVSRGRVDAVQTEHRTIPTDVVMLGLGVEPNVALGRDAGIPLGDSGAIAVDEHMRTRREGVWAAGDCAEKLHLVSRRKVSIALGTYANKEGRVAGIDIAGGTASFPGVLGTAATKVCDVEVARTGLTEGEATDANFDAVPATIDSNTRAGYFPGAAPIRVKLVVEAGSGRLLGGQIVGREGAAKRIDVVATALFHSMTASDMIDLDLSYAPPFSPLWDPVLAAARKAAAQAG